MKRILNDLPCKTWEVGGADTLSVNNNMLLCIVDYYSKFPIVKNIDAFSANELFCRI